jgi:hypothetical protein
MAQIMKIESTGIPPQGPDFSSSQPTATQKKYALAHALLTQASGTLQAPAVGAVGDPAPTDQVGWSMRAIGDMAAMDTLVLELINGKLPDGKSADQIKQELIGYAQDLYTNCQGKCTDTINALITGGTLGGVLRNFTISGGTVTGIPDSNLAQLDNDYRQPPQTDPTKGTVAVGVSSQVWGWLFPQPPSPGQPAPPSPFQGWGVNSGCSDALMDLMVFLANGLLNPTVTHGSTYDATTFGSTILGGGVSSYDFTSLFPMLVLANYVEQDNNGGKGFSQFQQDLKNLQDLLPGNDLIQAVYQAAGDPVPDTTHYNQLYANLFDPHIGLVPYYSGGGNQIPPPLSNCPWWPSALWLFFPSGTYPSGQGPHPQIDFTRFYQTTEAAIIYNFLKPTP